MTEARLSMLESVTMQWYADALAHIVRCQSRRSQVNWLAFASAFGFGFATYVHLWISATVCGAAMLTFAWLGSSYTKMIRTTQQAIGRMRRLHGD